MTEANPFGEVSAPLGMRPPELTVPQLIEMLQKFVQQHEGDPRLNLPVTVLQYESYRRVYGVELIDVTDECDHCEDIRCAYGGPRYTEAPVMDEDLEAAGFAKEGLHWQIVLQYHEVH
jgi:hypothetical protein